MFDWISNSPVSHRMIRQITDGNNSLKFNYENIRRIADASQDSFVTNYCLHKYESVVILYVILN